MRRPVMPAPDEIVMTRAEAALAHPVDDRTRAVQDPEQVHVDRAHPARRFAVAELREPHALGTAVPGVVDEDVDDADRRDRVGHRVVVGHVERRDRGGATRRGDLVDGALRPVGHDVVHVHRGALRREQARDARTHVLSGAGDDGRLAAEIEHACGR